MDTAKRAAGSEVQPVLTTERQTVQAGFRSGWEIYGAEDAAPLPLQTSPSTPNEHHAEGSDREARCQA